LRFFREFGETTRDEQGNPIRAVGGLKNVTELREQLIKLGMTMKAGSIGLWSVALCKDEKFSMDSPCTYDDEFRKLLGFVNESDFPNLISSWFDVIHPDDREAALKKFTDRLHEPSCRDSYEIEFRLKKKDGVYGLFHAFCTYLRNEAGNPIKVLGGLQDIVKCPAKPK